MTCPLARRIRAVAGLAALIPAAAQAQPGSPAGEMNLSLHYEGRLLIRVLDVIVTERISGRSFTATSEITTTGVLAAFRKINERATSTGMIDETGAAPGRFRHESINGKKPRSVEATWRDGGVAVRAQPDFTFLGDPPPTPAQKLEAVDPLTELMRMTLADSRTPPCQGVSRFFDGKQRYDLIYAARLEGRLSDRERKMGLTAPIACKARFREIAGFKRKPIEKQNQGLKTPITLTFAQVGAGGPWVIASLKTDTPLGAAAIQLLEPPKLSR